MTQDEDVRLLELATQLVLGPLAGEPIEIINRTGRAMAAITEAEFKAGSVTGVLANEALDRINAIGELLASMRSHDREQVEKGERWGRRSRALSQGEARKVLRGLTLDQLDLFADRSGHSLHELFEWSCGQREIHGGALWLLAQQDEMAKITGGER